MIGFAVYTAALVTDVAHEREVLETRVGALIALQRLQSGLDGLRDGTNDRREVLDARVAVHGAGDALRSLEAMPVEAEAAIGEVSEITDRLLSDGLGDPAAEHAALTRATISLRGANRATSETLGAQWESVEALAVLASLLLCAILGLLVWLRLTAVRVATAEERVRARLEASEAGFRRIIEASPYGIVLHDRGVIAYANPEVARALAHDADALVGRRLSEFLADPVEIRRGVVADGEHRFLHEQSSVQLEIASGPSLHFDGALRELSMVRDVTERRSIESQLRLSDRLAAVGSVAAGIAHEINNPLAYVLANANVLRTQLDELNLPAAPREALSTLVDDVREGAARVRDVVRGLRMLSHPSDEVTGPVALRPVIDSALAIVESDLSHRAEVSVELATDLPPVHANEARLGQVLLNLLVNAAHALRDEGPRDGRVSIRANATGEWVHMTVEDNGSGIPLAVQERIFEPFFTTKPIGEGTGLGLTICRRIVESLGGLLTLTSEAGVGTTVTVRLRAAEAVVAAPPRPRVDTPDHRARVLIVDDDEKVGASLGRLLRGHDCEIVTSGQEALERTASQHFDVIFCDLMMPEMTGMDVYDALEARGLGEEERLVFVTGGAFTDRAREFVAATPNVVVEKPFEADTVRRLTRDRTPEPRDVRIDED